MSVHPCLTDRLRHDLNSFGEKNNFLIFFKLIILKQNHNYHHSVPPLLFVEDMESSGVQNSHLVLCLLETQVLV